MIDEIFCLVLDVARVESTRPFIVPKVITAVSIFFSCMTWERYNDMPSNDLMYRVDSYQHAVMLHHYIRLSFLSSSLPHLMICFPVLIRSTREDFWSSVFPSQSFLVH